MNSLKSKMFHNIFSKKPLINSSSKIKITIDNREKNSLVPSELSALNIKIDFQQLEVGDYIVNNTIIERKTISDLKSSIINKRIFSQMISLKQYPYKILLIEGIANDDLYEGIIHENALRGFILAAALDYQIPLIFTKNEKDTAKYMSILAKRTPNKEISLRPSRIFKSKLEQMQFILEGFPNIGPIKAKALLEKFGSLKKIINASISDLEEILGKNAYEFKKLLEYDSKINLPSL